MHQNHHRHDDCKYDNGWRAILPKNTKITQEKQRDRQTDWWRIAQRR